jgi:hypothetical protein
VRETDGEHVAQVAERDKGRQTTCAGAVAEDVAEEEPSNDDFRFCKVGFRDRGEVGDVYENVEDGGAANGEGSGP